MMFVFKSKRISTAEQNTIDNLTVTFDSGGKTLLIEEEVEYGTKYMMLENGQELADFLTDHLHLEPLFMPFMPELHIKKEIRPGWVDMFGEHAGKTVWVYDKKSYAFM